MRNYILNTKEDGPSVQALFSAQAPRNAVRSLASQERTYTSMHIIRPNQSWSLLYAARPQSVSAQRLTRYLRMLMLPPFLARAYQ